MYELRRSSRRGRAAIASIATISALVALSGGQVVASERCWRPPVEGTVVDPFRPPACRWCAGNRGIEYRVRPGSAVRAVAGGEVTFAGPVVGRLYVVVRHADGGRVTYGLLDERSVGRGDRVVRGQRIGSNTEAFHFGLRQHDEYVDPAPFLGELRGRPRLVPVDGSAARPGPPPVLRCRAPATATTGSRRDVTVGALAGAR
ncbi:MAG: M23 family metallopeptidase [Actinomycetota bacterium]